MIQIQRVWSELRWKQKKAYVTKKEAKQLNWLKLFHRKLREDGGRTARVDAPRSQVIWMRREEGWFRVRKERETSLKRHSNPNRCTGPQTHRSNSTYRAKLFTVFWWQREGKCLFFVGSVKQERLLFWKMLGQDQFEALRGLKTQALSVFSTQILQS